MQPKPLPRNLSRRYAGNWLFSNRRWLSPAIPRDHALLLAGYDALCEAFPAFAAACPCGPFLAHLSRVAAAWDAVIYPGPRLRCPQSDAAPSERGRERPKRPRLPLYADGLSSSPPWPPQDPSSPPPPPTVDTVLEPLPGQRPTPRSGDVGDSDQSRCRRCRTVAGAISVPMLLNP